MNRAELIIDILLNADDNKLKQIALKMQQILSKVTNIDFDADEFEKQLKQLKKEIKDIDVGDLGFKEAIKDAETFSTKITKLGFEIIGIEQGAQAIQNLFQPFKELDSATQRIKTLGGEAKKLAPVFQEIALHMSDTIPISAVEIQTSIYDALSAGIEANESSITAFMEASAKLAIGGAIEIGDAVDQLSSLVNAYGESSDKTAQYSDDLFATVNLGKTSVAELNSSLSNVIPTAAAAGISFKNIGASLALMTANGIPTAQSTTKLNQLLIELLKPGADLAKILQKAGVSLESLRNESLPENLGKIKKALEEAGITATQAFGSAEASAAFNVLTKDIDKFQNTLAQFNNSTGTTQAAFEDMSQSLEARSQAIKISVESFVLSSLQSLGNLGAGLSVTFDTLTNIAPLLQSAFAIKSLIPNSLLTGVGGLAKALIQKLVPSLFAANYAQKALNATMLSNPYILAAAAAATLTVGIISLVEWLNVSTEEKLEAAKAENENTEAMIKSNQERVKTLENSIDLAKQFEAEGRAAMGNAELLVKLAQAYPGVIDETKSYEENLNNLREASQRTEKELSEMKDTITDLEKRKIQINIEIKTLEVQKAREELEDLLSPSFWEELITGGIAGIKYDKIWGPMIDSINNAESINELQKAFLMAQKKIYDAELDPEDRQKALSALENYKKAREKIIKEMADDYDKLVKQGLNDAEAIKALMEKSNMSESGIRKLIEAQHKADEEARKQAEELARKQEKEDKIKKIKQEAEEREKAYQKLLKANDELYKKTKDRVNEYDKELQIELKYFELAQKRTIIENNRQRNNIDDLLLAKKQLEILEKQHQELIKQYSTQKLIVKDGENWVLNPKMTLNENTKQQIIDDLQQLDYNIKNAKINILELTAKVKLDEKDLQNLQLELERRKLNIAIGLEPDNNYALSGLVESYLQQQSELIEAERMTKSEIAKLEIEFAQQSNENEKLRIKAQVNELKKLNIERRNEILDIEEKITGIINDNYNNRIELSNQYYNSLQENSEKYYDSQKAQHDKLSQLWLEGIQQIYDRNLNSEINQIEKITSEKEKALDRQRQIGVISEQHYQMKIEALRESAEKEKRELEENARLERLRSEAFIKGQQRELEREQAVESAKIIQENTTKEIKLLREKQSALQKIGKDLTHAEKQKLEQLQQQYDDAQKIINDRGTLLNESMAIAGKGFEEALTNLFAANPERAADNIRNTFATIMGVLVQALKKEASAAVVQMVLDWLNYGSVEEKALPIYIRLGLIPVITALVNGAINAIVEPVFNDLLSFSTGGRIDEPTLAVIGDASRLGGVNREWILRDEQLQLLISKAVNLQNATLLAELKQINKTLTTHKLTTRLSGNDIYLAVESTKNKIFKRAR